MSDKNAPSALACGVGSYVFMPRARVHDVHVRASRVIFEGEAVLFQKPIGPSSINHTYHSRARIRERNSECVFEFRANTCY